MHMPQEKRSRGKCCYCGRDATRDGLTRHLSTCSRRQDHIAAADEGTGQKQVLYHLRVKDAWSGVYWLHLEMKGSAELTVLDRYLRAIWLECCGHLSQFSVGGWDGKEISKRTTIERAFGTGVELMHIYDFGTSSHTLIRAVGEREGEPLTRHPIALMARNDPPEFCCMECDKPASWLCLECVHEFDEPGTLCRQHAEAHPHEDYGAPIPLVNSPRVGMCGYVGPAQPPY